MNVPHTRVHTELLLTCNTLTVLTANELLSFYLGGHHGRPSHLQTVSAVHALVNFPWVRTCTFVCPYLLQFKHGNPPRLHRWLGGRRWQWWRGWWWRWRRRLRRLFFVGVFPLHHPRSCMVQSNKNRNSAKLCTYHKALSNVALIRHDSSLARIHVDKPMQACTRAR